MIKRFQDICKEIYFEKLASPDVTTTSSVLFSKSVLQLAANKSVAATVDIYNFFIINSNIRMRYKIIQDQNRIHQPLPAPQNSG